MATREENLKKINDELELMSDEELEQVAGGNYDECVTDMNYLRHCGVDVDCDPHEIGFSLGIREAWAKVGIECSAWSMEYNVSVYKNKYYLDGKEISHFEACKHAAAVQGLNLNYLQVILLMAHCSPQ